LFYDFNLKFMDEKNNKKYVIIFLVVSILGGVVALAKFYILPKYFPTSIAETITESDKVEEVKSSEKSFIVFDVDTYNTNDIVLLSSFEKTEKNVWKGSGIIDEKICYEGDRSMGLISVDRKAATVELEQELELSDMEQIEFMLHVSDEDTFETAWIDFGDLDLKNSYRYTISNLKNGWNLIQIPKEQFVLSKAKGSTFSWSDVEKTRFYFLSRPSSILSVRIDMLRIINSSYDFFQQWRSDRKGEFLSLYEKDGEPILMARNTNIVANIATLKDFEYVGNNIYSVTISPQSSSRSGLVVSSDYVTGYGYYFLIAGDRGNTWEISKRNERGWPIEEERIGGTLSNMAFSSDKKYWLMVESRGNLMEFYFSFDGQKYEKLGELEDDEFRAGSVGITVFSNGWSLFDDFRFKRL
jgi:hypothetical protein